MAKYEVKRLSGTIPVVVYDRIKDYADSHGISVSGCIAVLCDMQLNAMNAQELLSEAKKINDNFQPMKSYLDTIETTRAT